MVESVIIASVVTEDAADFVLKLSAECGTGDALIYDAEGEHVAA